MDAAAEPMLIALLLVAAGLAAGGLGGLLGIGGGIVLMPLLRFVVGLSPAHAAGTCILAVFFTTLGGSYRHFRLGHIRLRPLVPIMTAGVIATALCSWAFVYLSARPRWLDFGMGLVFSLVSVRMVRAGLVGLMRGDTAELPREQLGAAMTATLSTKLSIGTAAGVLPGLLGIGTGAVLVPAFALGLRAPIRAAMGCSLACFCCNALASATFKAAQGYVTWAVAIPICAGTLVGANAGAVLNKRFPSSVIKLLFGVLFAYVALKFLLLIVEVKI